MTGLTDTSRQRGFTLIELILVIILLGIVATASFRFVGIGTQAYVDANDRLRLLNQSRFVMERLTRELRNSVPNSIRIAANCLEFSPMRYAGTYFQAPIQSTGDKLVLVSLDRDIDGNLLTASVGDRVVINATQAGYLYDLEQDRAIQLATGFSEQMPVGEPQGVREMTLTDDVNFARSSPRQRIYVAAPPVSYCVNQGQVYRFSDYGWLTTPQNFTALSGLATPQLMAQQVTNTASQAAFRFNDENVLTRNNVVLIYLTFTNQAGESMYFSREVHIANVP
ncbi:prepilin-type N-terminal cleavage/methylation domain-containing protein [Idiomarina xiamenensis]|uniref:Tfp-like pilus assembly protein n=1 Tax=Idiomarina xiamenensis 10-D-4 TaxID=740709 RepID=K2KC14_9GAMM|nr:prepilin-type N-terminal cleavage/methylation domain-containing protein [Idiomarina xiamenensis]EKE85398.1 Tfp-like pilus assembly protein [Idiomarina xiamenensis 10-D-4]